MEDKTTIGVTDAAAYLDKPRKVGRPVVANDLDIRLHSYLLSVICIFVPAKFLYHLTKLNVLQLNTYNTVNIDTVCIL